MDPAGALPRMVFIAGLLALLGGAVFFLAGNPRAPENPTGVRVPVEDCAAHGGAIRTGGMLVSNVCFVPYADAGKTCRDGDDCQGRCLIDRTGLTLAYGEAATGQCERESPTIDCLGVIEDGRLADSTCVT